MAPPTCSSMMSIRASALRASLIRPAEKLTPIASRLARAGVRSFTPTCRATRTGGDNGLLHAYLVSRANPYQGPERDRGAAPRARAHDRHEADRDSPRLLRPVLDR